MLRPCHTTAEIAVCIAAIISFASSSAAVLHTLEFNGHSPVHHGHGMASCAYVHVRVRKESSLQVAHQLLTRQIETYRKIANIKGRLCLIKLAAGQLTMNSRCCVGVSNSICSALLLLLPLLSTASFSAACPQEGGLPHRAQAADT